MQSVGPAAARHGSTRELIDDDNFTVLHDVVDILGKHDVGSEPGIEVMQ